VAKGICIKQAACGMRHEACGMGQSRMEIQLVTLEVWPATTTATAFWRPGGMIAMVDGDVLGWFLALVLGPRLLALHSWARFLLSSVWGTSHNRRPKPLRLSL